MEQVTAEGGAAAHTAACGVAGAASGATGGGKAGEVAGAVKDKVSRSAYIHTFAYSVPGTPIIDTSAYYTSPPLPISTHHQLLQLLPIAIPHIPPFYLYQVAAGTVSGATAEAGHAAGADAVEDEVSSSTYLSTPVYAYYVSSPIPHLR